MEATNTVEMQAETLSGDIRDQYLDILRGMDEPWTKLSEHQQKRIIGNVEKLSRDVVRGSVDIVAHTGFVHMLVTTGEWTVKDGIKLKVAASGSVEDITKLAEHGGGSAILVFADAASYFGQRAEAKADKDQPDLPIHDHDGVIQETELELNELRTEGDDQDEGAETDEGVSYEAEASGTKPRRRRRAAAGGDAPPPPEMPADTTRTSVEA
ncbi:hypothetical protein [Methylobacterium goesingense]|uniref:Uncharacterized protein n=1 Tax=Methylobacterium goesingense TaxID=243690 RepID=A0ABV2L222_9HYPH|nr:hypothetical protein [Methylobacterium goesingense]GJD72582.1 hypothetical protein CFIICLFH_0799 [Methylobacterium goesingense]